MKPEMLPPRPTRESPMRTTADPFDHPARASGRFGRGAARLSPRPLPGPPAAPGSPAPPPPAGPAGGPRGDGRPPPARATPAGVAPHDPPPTSLAPGEGRPHARPPRPSTRRGHPGPADTDPPPERSTEG